MHTRNIRDPLIDNLVFRYSTLSFAPRHLKKSESGEQTENRLTMLAQRLSQKGLDQDIMDYIIDHVFLPVQLPQDGEVNERGGDIAMLAFFRETIEQFCASSLTGCISLGSVIWKMARSIVKLHRKGYLDHLVLTDTLNDMSEGDIVPLYIEAQNAGVILRHKGQEIIFETFEVSPQNEAILKCKGRLLCSYPGSSIALPVAIFQDKRFLAEFTACLGAMNEELPTDLPRPKASKAGVEVSEIRDTVSPIYITEFLTGVLRGLGRAADTNRVCKRIADEVLWDKARIPWRRSPLWLVFRVALQTTLFQPARDPRDQNTEYKILMLYLMAAAVEGAAHLQGTASEKLAHMCRKLGRRAAKLDGKLPEGLLQIVSQAVHNGLAVLRTRFELIKAHTVRRLEWSPRKFDVQSETNLTMKNSRGYIKRALQRYTHPSLLMTSSAARIMHPIRIRHSAPSTLPSTSLLSEVGPERRIALHDIELWVQNSLAEFVSSNIHREVACQELFEFLEVYTKRATIEYTENPVDISLMLLTAMEIWVALDQIAVAICPLLTEHSCEVEAEMLSKLVLPTETLLRRLSRIEQHIKSRQYNAIHSESIFEDCSQLSHRSFAVKYYNRSPVHQELLAQITKKANESRAQKKAEYTRLKAQYDELIECCAGLSCECIGYGKGKVTCEQCSKRKAAKKLKIMVDEWPLPAGTFQTQALVVELRLPLAFRVWRDVTYELLVNIFHPSLEKTYVDSKHDLQHYQALSAYFLYSPGQSPRISWASEAKSFKERTHYKKLKIHAVKTEGDYLLPNGLVYQLSAGRVGQSLWVPEVIQKSRDGRLKDLTRLCTFQLPSPYSRLQYALDSTDHTTNFSIANQAQCPPEWSLHEYDAFTTLRSGFRIQWLNMLREIRAGNINLNRYEVHLLFMQAAWQAGPSSASDSQSARESHLKLQEEEFCLLVVDALRDSLQVIKENWAEQVSMQTLISLGCRVLSTTEFQSVKIRTALFLRECRGVCMDWMRDMMVKIRAAETDDSLQKWQRAAFLMAATCRHTFDVDLTDLDRLFYSITDVADFIECAVCVQDNTPPQAESQQLRMIIARDGRLAHLLESRLCALVLKNGEWLDVAISRVWPTYNPKGRSLWRLLAGENDRWITMQTEVGGNEISMTVHYNLLQGTLLVDGAPFGRLPKTFTTSPTYHRVLGNRIISVIRADLRGMEYQMVHPVYIDENSKNEIYLYFAMQDRELIIRAKTGKEGTDMYELIPHDKLSDDFPSIILNSCAHWLDLRNKTLEFRSLQDSKSLWTPSRSNWIITISFSSSKYSWRAEGVCELPAGCLQMIDFHGTTFEAVGRIFQTIESPHYIEVTLSGDSVNISLPRYQLDFGFSAQSLSAGGLINSRNFPGMVIDTITQDLGTLYGLESYIVLRRQADGLMTPGCVRHVIIPHAPVSVSYDKECQHSAVVLDTANFPTIKYHLYGIEPLLGSLTSNGSLKSKLFKIYLHALTAYCLPDPLTGLTGTEQALEDLRSSAAWSFQKLDSDDTLGPSEVDLLNLIAKLTPKRQFYPSHLMSMQQIKWYCLPSYIQHEDFYTIVQSILKYAEDIATFQPTPSKIQVSDCKNDDHLHGRASLRVAAYLPSQYGGSIFSRASDVRYCAREGGTHLEARVCRVSSLVKNWTSRLQPVTDLATILEAWKSISTFSRELKDFGYKHRWHEEHFGQDWYSLYNFFRKAIQTRDLFKILFILSSFAYQGEKAISLTVIESLLAFATNPIFSTINPPDIPYKSMSPSYIYDLTMGTHPSAEKIRSIVRQHAVQLESSPQWKLSQNYLESANAHWARRRDAYNGSLQKDVEYAVNHYQNQWVCSTVASLPAYSCPLLTSEALVPLNETFGKWYHNRNYMQHIAKVQLELDRLRIVGVQSLPTLPCINRACYSPQPAISCVYNMQDLLRANRMGVSRNFRCQLNVRSTTVKRDFNTAKSDGPLELLVGKIKSKACGFQMRYIEDLEVSLQALKVYDASTNSDAQPILPGIQETHEHIVHCQTFMEHIEDDIMYALSPAEGTTAELLQRTGLGPRLTTKTLLRQLARKLPADTDLSQWQNIFVSFAEAISAYQQALRLHHHACRHDLDAFMKEWVNRGRKGWNPSQHSEWLLFEIENNLLIRQVQAEIASEMLVPRSGCNTVMQLNMGEGKSSVIVPIVAAALADTSKLVRVVVLKPLSSQMFHLLVQKLGGLLNRRIYYLPFSRQVELDPTKVGLIWKLYAECMERGGILLSQPEHILSFKLVGLENLCNKSNMAPALLNTQHWLDQHCRDILDESDEVLHVRYQLIYTMGQQRAPDLSPDRWSIIQEIFTLVAAHMPVLKQRYPEEVQLIIQELKNEEITNGSNYNAEFPGSFPLTRLLKKAHAEADLVRKLAEDIIMRGLLGAVSTQWFTTRKSELALKFITVKNCEEDELRELGEVPPQWLLLRGLLAHGILGFALREKRWRVDYGLAPSRSMLAVPFRAKDSPAPRSEFGHPDVAIILTCLSYYYNGLEEEQLQACFRRLKRLDNPGQEYLIWIRDCGNVLPEALKQLNGINLEDDEQWKSKIYPLLKHNKRVIDFYLGNTVFPKACKEFPKKLTTTGWDLVEQKAFPTTGFSGTNDNRYLLPVSVEQLDLHKHRHTNAKVLNFLLQPENDSYTRAQTPEGERLRVDELLYRLSESAKPVQVLLDVGAQVLEMTNKQVAEHWLGLATRSNQPWIAAVYFDDDDELMVISKDGSIQPYMISPYVKNMDRCLVYLDESHTRGTDIKLPRKSVAAVTLGPKLTKDRLVQACMRMRQLGYGQSVRFFAPPEVHNKLLEHSGKKDGDNIRTHDIIEWVIYETCLQTQRSIPLWANQGINHQAHQSVWDRCLKSNDYFTLSEAWQEPESHTLEEMYGVSDPQKHSILQIIQKRCEEFEVSSLQEVSVQEEQEREVSNEVEREQQVERPELTKPAQHYVHPALITFIKTGVVSNRNTVFLPMMDALQGTSFYTKVEHRPWAAALLATVDFINTVETRRDTYNDDYLRPVSWIVSSFRVAGGVPILCLLSPFEVNELLPLIQNSTKVNLHMYSPKVQRQAPTFEDLNYATIPTLRCHHSFPGQDQLIMQLNLFSGQLFFKSYESYKVACSFLGIYLRKAHYEVLPAGVGVDGFLPGWRGDGVGSNVGVGVAFQMCPIRFLEHLIAVRRKGMKYESTHMGLLVHAKELGEEDF
ncbi:hypothetical protein L211DRAFT_804139 [Terfezia boudieri ATCC MYA-4762]|uniref:ubiquitinyl hydrolase 1 n=1 Tax=Terfezia boudieri ATCC MYA-4762 TaxID=1051890 RepID=A0A3N4LUR0_9PEZI|nr:hypothetical protein L211DRAFT_804139 [Terfezia boudieri ATCC MYA-4762]